MRRFLAASLLALSPAAFAFPQAGQDITDLWWNPDESGWGMNVMQQSDVAFATIFVYGTSTAPTWFVASNVTNQGQDASTGESVWSGTLYQTSGPVYTAAAFNPNAVNARTVGTLTLRVGTTTSTTSVYTGRLAYTVDGATITKTVVRQAWRTANHAGTYYGMVRETWSGCSTASNNGEYATFGTFTVSQSGATPPTLQVYFLNSSNNFSYTFTGSYYQSGRSGVIPGGTVSSAQTGGSSSTGTLTGLDIQSGTTGFSATYTLTGLTGFGGCVASVRIAAAR